MKTLTLEKVTDIASVGTTPLEARLRTIGIEPIPADKIAAYKREQIRLNPPNGLGLILSSIGIPADKEVVDIALPIALGLTFMGAVLFGGATAIAGAASFGDQQFLSLAFFCGIGLAATGGLCGAIGTFFGGKVAVYPAKWESVPWRTRFCSAMEVIHRAGIIERALGDVRLEVDELWQDKILIDPILFVADPTTNERVAVDVWDENGRVTL